ncbi:MAG: hypothetical protein AB7S38_18280 [Vulcanimicrobiota bacterium]
MKNAGALIEEFENVAYSVHTSPNANSVLPGVKVVHNQPLNRYRNSVASARLSYHEHQSAQRFFDRVGALKLQETSQCNGVTVVQQWHYERNGQAERYLFVRDFEEGRVRECATLERCYGNDEVHFNFSREALD